MQHARKVSVSWYEAQVAASHLSRNLNLMRLSRTCSSQMTCAAQVMIQRTSTPQNLHVLMLSSGDSAHVSLTRSLTSNGHLQTSKRVALTDDPVIVKTKQLMAGSKDVISLAQGPSPPRLPSVVYHDSYCADAIFIRSSFPPPKRANSNPCQSRVVHTERSRGQR